MTNAGIYHITQSLREHLLPAMLYVFGDRCASCGEQYGSYDIDHKRYATDITMYDLQLLCTDCHRAKTGISNEANLTHTSHCSTCTCY